jgi:hypothetical protein
LKYNLKKEPELRSNLKKVLNDDGDEKGNENLNNKEEVD